MKPTLTKCADGGKHDTIEVSPSLPARWCQKCGCMLNGLFYTVTYPSLHWSQDKEKEK